MAEQDEGGDAGAGLGGFLTQKVGPLQLWVYALAFVVVWYVLEKRNSASAASSTSSTAGAAAGSGSSYGTDPAGNTGVIDPSTGYVAGSPEDQAALSQQTSATGSSGTYSTNQAWETAAINYLVSLGEDPTVANSAVAAYLGSQPLTTAQQAMVNQAVQALGAPPQPPSPTTSTPVVSPPGGATTYATNPPTGLTVTSTSGSSIGLKWNAATNATGYTVTATPASSAAGTAPVTVSTSTPIATVTGLAGSTSYKISVQGTPADAGAPSATTTASTSFQVIGTPTGVGPVGTTGDYPLTAGQEIRVQVNIQPPNTMAKVASHYGIALQHLIDTNPGSSASTTGVVWVPYLVQKNDTVSTVAGKFGISVEHLEQELSQEGVI